MPKDLTPYFQDMIAREGPIPVEAFMAKCVSSYYSEGQVFGRDGDFITAPEISQVFGELIGLWTAVIWHSLGRADPVRLVELGPGRGTLMSDLVRAAKGVPGFLEAADLHLVEQSPGLREVQKATLAHLDVSWHESVETVPPGPALIIANEFLDALPVQQFQKTEAGWAERTVTLDEAGLFIFSTGKPSDRDGLPDAPPGTVLEQSPAVEAAIRLISERIIDHGGAALVIDYGYDKAGFGDTLQAVQRHRKVPALAAPGMADLTAHVNFNAVRNTAEAAGTAVFGPVPQGIWLSRLGLDVRQAQLTAASPEKADDIQSRCRRLADPKHMGELFKVLAIAPPGTKLPEGFTGDDPR